MVSLKVLSWRRLPAYALELNVQSLARIFGFLTEKRSAELPKWFQPNQPKDALSERPIFLYQSWIPEHTDKLILSLARPQEYQLKNIDMFSGQADKLTRASILKFAAKNGDLYRKMCLHKLMPYRERAAGLVVTLDWTPAMRHLVYAASQLGIPTILVPHESVFASRSMYYLHPKLFIDTPACDLVCTWGDLQTEIFIERGYPVERIVKTGGPKFDYLQSVRNLNPSHKEPLRALGLDPFKFTVTFATQPLDSQYTSWKKTMRAQEDALTDALDWIQARENTQLMIRLPPSRGELFGKSTYERIAAMPNAAVDDSNLYLLSAEEAIAASETIISVNSTMLLEAALCGRTAISSKYIHFDQIWDNLKIPVAHNRAELHASLDAARSQPAEIVAKYDIGWAEKQFSNSGFDGRAAERISEIFVQISRGNFDLKPGYAQTTPFLPG
nr:hypothetical protein [uncultured Shinella sp.]